MVSNIFGSVYPQKLGRWESNLTWLIDLAIFQNGLTTNHPENHPEGDGIQFDLATFSEWLPGVDYQPTNQPTNQPTKAAHVSAGNVKRGWAPGTNPSRSTERPWLI